MGCATSFFMVHLVFGFKVHITSNISGLRRSRSVAEGEAKAAEPSDRV